MKNSKALLVMAGLALAGCGGGSSSSKALKIKGSDTELNLVQSLAEKFMNKNQGVSISVIGGGSGTGIAALINGQVDVANSSRPIKDEEIQRAEANGIQPTEFIVANDAIAVIVNPDNPVSDISIEDLSKVFKGEITNWNQIGGPDQAISLYGRQSNSGTYVFFQEHVVKGDYSPQMKAMNGNSQIVEGVKHDAAGIGYVGLGYVRKGQSYNSEVKVLKVNGLLPHQEGYPVFRSLYQYINGKPTGLVKAFLEFELSDEAQKTVEEIGFIPIKGTKFEAKAKELLQ